MTGNIARGRSAVPLVSILIPAFNHERFVQRCLDSVLSDPYPAKEIVIIDDGSTDATARRISEWVERHRDRITIEFVCRENRGIAATLNELAARARGSFFRIGASDDYLLPGGCLALVGFLLDHPEAGAVIGDSIVVDQDGEKLYDSGMRDLHHADKRLYGSLDGIRRAVISQWAIGGPVTMIRRSVLETVGRWSEGLRIDDWDLFLRLAARDELAFIDVRVCAYRLHGDNFSKTRHIATRVINLSEARQVALRRASLFGEPYRTLLRAEAQLIGAKIAWLERRPARLGLYLATYASLLAASKLRFASPAPRMERA